MDHHSISLAIAGDITHTISKEFVTAAEIVMLQQIHGSHAVTNIKPTGSFDHDSDGERNRLGELYNDQKVDETFTKYGELPTTLSSAKVEDSYMDQVWLEQNKSKPKKAAKKVTKKRARTSEGHFVADDPDTPENEAFVEG